jgi:hypothetical protein
MIKLKKKRSYKIERKILESDRVNSTNKLDLQKKSLTKKVQVK